MSVQLAGTRVSIVDSKYACVRFPTLLCGTHTAVASSGGTMNSVVHVSALPSPHGMGPPARLRAG
jgi:hypothetical protein